MGRYRCKSAQAGLCALAGKAVTQAAGRSAVLRPFSPEWAPVAFPEGLRADSVLALPLCGFSSGNAGNCYCLCSLAKSSQRDAHHSFFLSREPLWMFSALFSSPCRGGPGLMLVVETASCPALCSLFAGPESSSVYTQSLIILHNLPPTQPHTHTYSIP